MEPLPHGLIPEPFRPWLEDIACRMQCPLDYVAIAAIVTAASVIGAGCGVRPKQRDNWMVIPNLWGGVVGRPGSLKSPALSEVLNPLIQLEKRAHLKFDKEEKDYLCTLEAHKIAKNNLLSNNIEKSF